MKETWNNSIQHSLLGLTNLANIIFNKKIDTRTNKKME